MINTMIIPNRNKYFKANGDLLLNDYIWLFLSTVISTVWKKF